MSMRPQVLRLYRRVFREARVWAAENERDYIRNEARRLVRRNAQLTNMAEIRQKVAEFEARIDIALHYGIPFPRFTNVVPGATGEKPDTVSPLYLDSYGENTARLVGQKPHRAPIPHEE